MKRKRKNKMKTKLKRRDSLIMAAYSRQINLNVRVVKSKRDYDRKSYKTSTKKEANLFS